VRPSICLTILTLLLAPLVGRAQPACPPGQSVTVDTAGRCCWGGQVWSPGRQSCIGIPECPAGMAPQGEECVGAAPQCPYGQSVTVETGGHCCWSGQVWSTARQACVGVPQCPPGLAPTGESCAAASTTVPITFAARSEQTGAQFRVTVGLQSCTTPCMLNLRPGPAQLAIESTRPSGRYHEDIVVPAAPSLVRLSYRGIGGWIMGPILVSLGIPLTIGGAYLLSFYNSTLVNNSNNTLDLTLGTLSVVAGAVCVVGGIMQTALAGRHTAEVAVTGAAQARRPQLLSLGAAPLRDGVAAGAAIAF
jgi:hypothetical protein